MAYWAAGLVLVVAAAGCAILAAIAIIYAQRIPGRSTDLSRFADETAGKR